MEIIVNAYFKVKAEEIEKGRIEKQGFFTYISIEWEGVLFRTRRVRVAGRVADIVPMSRRIDVLLIDDTGQVLIRAWDDKKVLVENLDINDIVDVFGTLRIYNNERYIVPIIVVRIDERRLEERIKEIKEDRRYLINLYSKSSKESVEV